MEHKEPTPNWDCYDLELTSLVEKATKVPEVRRMFSNRIRRIRRRLRRRRNNARLAAAGTAGGTPLVGAKSHHVNWKRIFGDTDPADAISKFYGDIFELDGKDLRKATAHKQMWWKDGCKPETKAFAWR